MATLGVAEVFEGPRQYSKNGRNQLLSILTVTCMHSEAKTQSAYSTEAHIMHLPRVGCEKLDEDSYR